MRDHFHIFDRTMALTLADEFFLRKYKNKMRSLTYGHVVYEFCYYRHAVNQYISHNI